MSSPSTNSPRAHVLMTGVSGFIGAACARELVSRGATVVGLDDLSAGNPARHASIFEAAERGGGTFRFLQEDTRNERALAGLLSERPTSVVHLAARVGVRRVLADTVGCERENLDGCRALANAILRSAVGSEGDLRLLAASTSEVYAESSDPLSEASSVRSVDARGRWRYAASKYRSEQLLDRAGKAIHLRFFNVVGPGQDGSSGMVLPRFVERARAGEALNVHGTGEQVRTFAHVDAVARDVAALAAPELFGISETAREFTGALNVGGTATTSIRGLAEAVLQEAAERATGGPRPRLAFVDPEVDVAANFEDVDHRVPDLSLLRSLGLGQEPWALSDIIRDTLERHSIEGQRLVASVPCASPVS